MFESLQRQISAHPAHLATILAIPMLAPLVAFTLSHVVFALDPFNLNAPQSFWEAWARVVEGRQDFDNILWTVRLVQSVGNLMAGALMLVWIRYAVELFRGREPRNTIIMLRAAAKPWPGILGLAFALAVIAFATDWLVHSYVRNAPNWTYSELAWIWLGSAILEGTIWLFGVLLLLNGRSAFKQTPSNWAVLLAVLVTVHFLTRLAVGLLAQATGYLETGPFPEYDASREIRNILVFRAASLPASLISACLIAWFVLRPRSSDPGELTFESERGAGGQVHTNG